MKAHHLVRRLARASDKPSYHTDDILARFQRVKKIAKHSAVGSVHHDKLRREVIRLEKVLVERSKKNKDLRRELRELKLHNSVTDTADLNKKFDRLIFLLGELAAKMSVVSKSKAQTHQRRHHLEKRIEKSVKKRSHHLIQTEKKIEELERILGRLKRKKTVDPERLAVVEDRIKELRRQLFYRRIHQSHQVQPMILPNIPAKRADMTVQPRMTSGTFKKISSPRIFDHSTPDQTLGFSNQLPSVHGIRRSKPVIPLEEVPLPPHQELQSEFPPPPPQRKKLLKRLFGR
jgi:hypothetical protein